MMRLIRSLVDWLIAAILVGCLLALAVSAASTICIMMWQSVL